jgi:anti-sigma-K factor RskA
MPRVQDGYLVLAGEYTGETVAMTVEPAGGSPEPTTDAMILLS